MKATTKRGIGIAAKWIAVVIVIQVVVASAFGLGILTGGALERNSPSNDVVGTNTDEFNEQVWLGWDLYMLVNEERGKAKLNQLDFSPYLSYSANDKCDDMVKKDYWAHTSPDGQEPWGFITKRGIEYEVAAENLAYGHDDAKSIVDNWMRSETHRANILNPDLTTVGFGVCSSDNYRGAGEQTIVVQHLILPR